MNAARFDVVVIGGGIAGLAAARDLAAAGRSVAVVEAKPRLGGRIWTWRRGGMPAVELGAEFVHGGNADLWQAARAFGLKRTAVGERHWRRTPAGLRPAADIWRRVAAAVRRLGAARDRGASVGELWLRHPDALSPEDADLVLSVVEGFEAAPIDRMSAAALVDLEMDEGRQWRLVGGYDGLVEGYATALDRAGVSVRLSQPVRRVRWRRGWVEVAGRATLRARMAVVTLPLGVWRAGPRGSGGVAFDPPLHGKREVLSAWAPGDVKRINLVFDDIWRDRLFPAALRRNHGAGFGFVHAGSAAAFPVWWSRGGDPVLTGWAGGPRAAALAGLGPEAVGRAAVASLGLALGVEPRKLEARLARKLSHDWNEDPFARGGYAYLQAGWEDAPSRLRRPVAGTLFFAGEATAEPAELGTVHGALSSGRRAAREIEAELLR